MVQAVAQRFQGSCTMIMRREGEEVTFLGSGFLVHSEGYLLTTARTVAQDTNLVVVPPALDELFPPVTQDKVAPVPAEVVARDAARDVALLKLTPDLDINMPGEILGSSEADPQGSTVISLGIPFGYYRVHTAIVTQAILAGRVTSRTGSRLIIFDRRVQFGDIGGPLISAESGTVIGIVGGVFDPLELDGVRSGEGMKVYSDLSYALAIEYGTTLLEQSLAATSEETE